MLFSRFAAYRVQAILVQRGFRQGLGLAVELALGQGYLLGQQPVAGILIEDLYGNRQAGVQGHIELGNEEHVLPVLRALVPVLVP